MRGPAVLSTIVGADEARPVTNLSVATAVAPPSPTVACTPQPAWTDLPTDERARLKSRQGISMVTSEEVRVVEQIPKNAPQDVTLVDVPADGETMGEVVMRGNVVMKEYFHNPDATEQAFAGGWFHSGDLAVRHPDSYIQILDRAKDVVISGGENISTIEVEQAVISHPAIADVSVIGVPDDRWGETLRAYVVLAPGVEPDNAPRAVGHRPLPRTSTGKVCKNVLRDEAVVGNDPVS